MLILYLCKTTLRKHKKQNKTLTLHWQTEKDSQGEFELKKTRKYRKTEKNYKERHTHTLIAEERKTTRPTREYTNTNS
jgi:hypothetical protein